MPFLTTHSLSVETGSSNSSPVNSTATTPSSLKSGTPLSDTENNSAIEGSPVVPVNEAEVKEFIVACNQPTPITFEKLNEFLTNVGFVKELLEIPLNDLRVAAAILHSLFNLTANQVTDIVNQNQKLYEFSIQQKLCYILQQGEDRDIINLLDQIHNGNEKYVLDVLLSTQPGVERYKIELFDKVFLNQAWAKKYITGGVIAQFEEYLHSDMGSMRLYDKTFMEVLYSNDFKLVQDKRRECLELEIPSVPELIKLYKRKFQKEFPDVTIAKLIRMKESTLYSSRVAGFNELTAILDKNVNLEKSTASIEEVLGQLLISGIDEPTKNVVFEKLKKHTALTEEITANLPQLTTLEAALPHHGNESFSKWMMQCAIAGFDFAKEKLNSMVASSGDHQEQINELLCTMIADKECTLEDVNKIFTPDNLGEIRSQSLAKPEADPFIGTVLKEFEDSNYDIDAITTAYAPDGRNNILAFYFEQNKIVFNWPQKEINIKERVICQLLLTNKISVKDMLEHGLTLIRRLDNVVNRKYFLTVIDNNMTFDTPALTSLDDTHQTLFPLVNSKSVELTEIKNCGVDSIKFLIYQNFATRIDWNNSNDPLRQELAEIIKLFGSKKFDKLKTDFLDPLEAEIEKLKTDADKEQLNNFLNFKKRITKVIIGLKACKDQSKKVLRTNLAKMATQFFLEQGKASKPVTNLVTHFINTNCDINEIAKNYGTDSRNNLLHFYLNQQGSAFVWPRAQSAVKGNIVCELILNGKLKLATAVAASADEIAKLAHPAVAAYLREMVQYDRRLNFAKIFACDNDKLRMFPLIDKGLLTAQDLAAMPVDSLEYKILLNMTAQQVPRETRRNSRSHAIVRTDSPVSSNSSASASDSDEEFTSEWNSSLFVSRLRTAIAYFKSDEFQFIKQKVLAPIQNEIERLEKTGGTLLVDSGEIKMFQMRVAHHFIKEKIQKEFVESFMTGTENTGGLINTDTTKFTNKLNKTVLNLVKSLAKQESINQERNLISGFFRQLLLGLYRLTKPFVKNYNPQRFFESFRSQTGKKVDAIKDDFAVAIRLKA